MTHDVDAKDRDGTWCIEANRLALLEALRGTRGRKQLWWMDAPRPLRCIASRGERHEISVVALPTGCLLPAHAFPSGSVIFLQPLLGQVRRTEANRTEQKFPPKQPRTT